MDVCPMETGETMDEDDIFGRGPKAAGDAYLEIIDPQSPSDVSSDGWQEPTSPGTGFFFFFFFFLFVFLLYAHKSHSLKACDF